MPTVPLPTGTVHLHTLKAKSLALDQCRAAAPSAGPCPSRNGMYEGSSGAAHKDKIHTAKYYLTHNTSADTPVRPRAKHGASAGPSMDVSCTIQTQGLDEMMSKVEQISNERLPCGSAKTNLTRASAPT